MPNRILREGHVESESVSALSDWTHRVYFNLFSKADDAGRHDGRVALLRSRLFPLGTSKRDDDFRKAVAELQKPRDADDNPLHPLVIAYKFEGKPYLQLTKWERCGNTERSHHPWTDGSHEIEYVVRHTARGDKQFVSTSIVDDPIGIPSASHPDEGRTESDTKTETKSKTKTPRARSPDVMPEIPESLIVPEFVGVWSQWQEHIRQKHKKLTPLAAAQQLKRCEEWGLRRAVAAINYSIMRNWGGIFESKNGSHDEPMLSDPPTAKRYAS